MASSPGYLASSPSGMTVMEEEPAGMGPLCVLCGVRPRTIAMQHGGTAHRAACEACTRALLAKSKGKGRMPCPVCATPVDRVFRGGRRQGPPPQTS